MKFISMFSGIEAASVAFGPLGWEAVAFAEIEKFPSAVLAHHYPHVPNVGDMSAHDWSQYRGKVDIVCGGPPCQAFSVAGLRESMNDARGNLSLSYMRALHAISPRNAIVENVPGWLNTPDNAFGCFLAGLVGADDALLPSPKPADGKSDAHWRWSARKRQHTLSWPSAGLVSGPKGRAAWCILNAQHFGLAQRRKRVIVVADFGNGADPAAVLFERNGLPGYSPKGREAGKDVAPTVASGFGSGSEFDVAGTMKAMQGSGGWSNSVDHAASGYMVPVGYAPEIARCVATREGSSQDYETTTMVAVTPIDMRQASRGATMTNNRKDGQSGGAPGTGIGEVGDPSPTISTSHPPAICVTGEIAHTLKAEGADASEDGTGRGTPIIAHTVSIRGRDGGATAELGGEVATALRASQGGRDKPHVLAFQSSQSGVRVGEVHATLDSNNGSRRHNGAFTDSAVRRLTPTECERLQGFPAITKILDIEVCAEEKIESVKFAAPSSAVQSPGQSAPVHAHVLIDLGRSQVELRRAGKLIWSASGAEELSRSLPSMRAEDFARLVAHMTQTAVPQVLHGKAESQTSTSRSSDHWTGSASARVSGGVIAGLVSDAERFTETVSQCMRFITSRSGQNSSDLGWNFQTLSSCAVAAIASSIPGEMSVSNSWSIRFETVQGYTDIPWRSKPTSPDGPRYKALGNSWAVPKFVWLGRRIAMLMPQMQEAKRAA